MEILSALRCTVYEAGFYGFAGTRATQRVEKGLARLSYHPGTEGPVKAEPTSAGLKHTATNPTSASAERVGAPRLRFLASSYDLSSSSSADARATIPSRAVVVLRSSRRGAKALSGILEPVWCNSVRPNQDRPHQSHFCLPANDSRRVRSASLCGLRSSPYSLLLTFHETPTPG
jgi:hypothetical protein